MTNPDFEELLRGFNVADVRYLVVGAYAVVFHSRPRYTNDLDLWIDPAPDNALRAWQALARFGAPLKGVSPQDFTSPDTFYQLGVEPNRIDILTSLASIDFANAWARKLVGKYGDVDVHFLSKPDLIDSKRAAGRPRACAIFSGSNVLASRGEAWRTAQSFELRDADPHGTACPSRHSA